MRTDDLNFDLPPELIAQQPAEDRAASRLLHYRRSDQSIAHRRFSDLPELLRHGDLLVFNDAQVIPARFMLAKETGGLVEALFLGEDRPGQWRVLLKNVGTYRRTLHFVDAPLSARFIGPPGSRPFMLEVNSPEPAIELLQRVGRMPLPPYIKRRKGADPRDEADRERYQTIYGRVPGAVAAPTAGFHFTEDLLATLDRGGIERAFVTLHVGIGTFQPVSAKTLAEHTMHSESYALSREAAEALNRAKHDPRRIIAVGTTAARVLESQPPDQPFVEKADQTSIFIYPPYEMRHVSAMITNFHLPRSTLIAMVAAMVGLDEQRRIYQTAIAQRYRFFSYGDAMFIE